jgi:hypothetical protein
MNPTSLLVLKSPANKRLTACIHPTAGIALLEALLAMSLVCGMWIASIEAYQRLLLRNIQIEEKRIELRKQQDRFEGDQQMRLMGFGNPKMKGQNESSRVSHRNRTQHITNRSSH